MEFAVPASAAEGGPYRSFVGLAEEIRVRRKALETVMKHCHRALELLQESEVDGNLAEAEMDGKGVSNRVGSASTADDEVEQLCCHLRPGVESRYFIEKLGSIHSSVSTDAFEENTSWNVITPNDQWDDKQFLAGNESDEDSYVLVRQEDIVGGIACFMAAYLLSLKDSKDFDSLDTGIDTKHLQEALCKTFSGQKKKSGLQKAWDSSKVIYKVASWTATAIGICQNPALVKPASVALKSSCRAI